VFHAVVEPKPTKKRPVASVIRRESFASAAAADGEDTVEGTPCPVVIDGDNQPKPAPFLLQPVKFARTVVHPRLISGPRPSAHSPAAAVAVSLSSTSQTSDAPQAAGTCGVYSDWG
jgi:hypothetical protein